jgi:hypothetical protein
MRAFIWRALLPLLALAGGIGCLVYGIGFHTASVAEEQEVEIPPPPPMFTDPGRLFDSAPGGPAFPGLPPFPSEVKEKVIVAADEPEPRLIREVSVGGVTLLASGELRRTYSGESPSLCPT